METTTASACGKLILFGEHAVVYGKPAIAVPLKELKLNVEVRENKESDNGLEIESRNFEDIELLKKGTIRILEKLGIKNNTKLFIENHKNSQVCSFVLSKVLENREAELIKQKNKADKIILSSSLDDNAESIIYNLSTSGLNNQNLPKHKQKNKTIIQPLYLLLDKEIQLYAKLTNMNLNNIKNKKLNQIKTFLNTIDNKGENKAAIVNSYLALFN